MRLLESLAQALGLGRGTVVILLGVGGLLLVGTVKRAIWLRRRAADEDDRRRWRSAVTWWVLFLVMVVALVLGRWAVVLLTVALSILLLREALRLAGAEALYPVAALGALALYGWAWLDWTTVFLAAVPVLVAAWVAVEVIARLREEGGPGSLRPIARALLLSVVGPSFVVAVASLPAHAASPTADMGWLVLLVVLTELNDSAQAWWGRNFGSRRMAPRISPRKTWVGLLGGLATTVAAAALLAPLVTGYGRAAPVGLGAPDETFGPPWLWSAALGLVVGLAATGGDLAASSLKRRAGVKDSGTLLPGHGGLLDRLDSLALSAPVYFYVTWLLWHPPG